MICSASLALVVASLSGSVADTVPTALVVRVRAEIAARWQVDTAAVQLEWGQWVADSNAAAAPFRLTGGLNEGWFAVTILPAHASPRAVRVHAGTHRNVPTASHALAIGHRLDSLDINMAPAIAWGAPVQNPARDIVGWEVRRPLREGDQLLGPGIAPPVVISTGDSVVLTWAHGGVHVERQGVALQPARQGDQLRVRSGALAVTAFAVAPDTARVGREP
ncbi:MAG TPA: flagellar basal body P-ring formation chaperone FlgA [Gemmatimonadales bacterium]|jgi:flagella basal body P-ring formation protein FlgA